MLKVLHLRCDEFWADRETLCLAQHDTTIDGLSCPLDRQAVVVVFGLWTGGNGGYYALRIGGRSVGLIGLVSGMPMPTRVIRMRVTIRKGEKLQVLRRGDVHSYAGRFDLFYQEGE